MPRPSATAPRGDTGFGSLVAARLRTPLGSMIAAARDEGLCLLTFPDRGEPQGLARRMRLDLVYGDHVHLGLLRGELEAYFAGNLKRFTVPLLAQGTSFQEAVWGALSAVPWGGTTTYEALARAIGSPAAVRAVGRANGANPVSILIPCHRVLGKDGDLRGYGGGLWRKRLLLELEATGRLPTWAAAPPV